MSVVALSVALISVISGVIIDKFGYLVLLLFNVLIFVLVLFVNLYTFALDCCAEKQVLNVSGKTRRKK